VRCKRAGGWQTDVTQTKDAYFVEVQCVSSIQNRLIS
jgi:hypothetical protein